MAYLTDLFSLKRAGRFSYAGTDENLRLPIVYGDLTDGAKGNWVMPWIDAGGGNYIYCYAGHPVQTVAEGNVITVYCDDVEFDAMWYDFDASDSDYENMATISIHGINYVDGGVYTVKGKGKYADGSLMENIVDIVYDFLTVENSWTSSLFDSTSLSRARSIFTAQGYKAAGLITEDIRIWDLVQEMMGSFYGAAFLNGLGEMVLDIDNGVVSEDMKSGIITKANLTLISATQRMVNLINKAPIAYSFDYIKKEFRNLADEVAYHDLISQSTYGIQEPSEPMEFRWCRDLATINAIQTILVNKFKDPIWEIEIEDASLDSIAAGVDVGDYLIASVEALYDRTGSALLNELWKIIGWIPMFRQKKTQFRLLDTRVFLTSGGVRDTTIY